VVFTFSKGIPGYAVGYVNKVVSDPKGDVVALPGRAFLRVVFRPSSGGRKLDHYFLSGTKQGSNCRLAGPSP
jgi:hypothetical protein